MFLLEREFIVALYTLVYVLYITRRALKEETDGEKPSEIPPRQNIFVPRGAARVLFRGEQWKQ